MERETMEIGNSTETILQEIATSREAIEHELATTKNDWFACYATRLTIIKNELELGNMGGEISDDKFGEINSRIDTLTSRAQKLRTENHGARDIDENLKNELFSKLEEIGRGL